MPNWSMDRWETGKPLTFLEALGFSKAQFTFPQLQPQLPAASAKSQHPINVSGGGGGGSTGPVTGGPPPTGPIKQYARKLLGNHSWTGASQWAAFNALEMGEAGWNPRIKNTQSGALGLAQALGHGNANTQGTLGNEYGGFGLSDKQAKEANSGNPYWQLVWMTNYIEATYGSPVQAYNTWLSRNPHWY